MNSSKFNCIVGQSGGPTSVINASLCGVIETCIKSDHINTVYGTINGIEGLLNNKLLNLSNHFPDEDSRKKLMYSPSMFLGSCRYKLKKYNESTDEYEKIFRILESNNIRYFFYIGGNDSMDTVLQLSKYAKEIDSPIRFIGIPKTIDNDLFGTDHTPGFGSAAKYIATTVLSIAHDTYTYDIPSVTIIEIMGRNAGWLTAASALARNEYNTAPDLIYLPEVPFSKIKFIKDIRNVLSKKNNVIVCVSEGVKDENNQYLSHNSSGTDAFGHSSLHGTGRVLEDAVKLAIGCKVRSIELSVLQRSAMHLASETDILEAFNCGKIAVDAMFEGLTGCMVVMNRKDSKTYEISYDIIDVSKTANKEKTVPLEYICDDGTNVSEEIISYIKPLIQGEPNISYRDGLPMFSDIKHLVS